MQEVDTSSFVGGNIIGIGSKANHKSMIVYEKATNYHQFEFIWDPSKDTMGHGRDRHEAGQVQTGQGFGQGFRPAMGQPVQIRGRQPGTNPNGFKPLRIEFRCGSSFGGSNSLCAPPWSQSNRIRMATQSLPPRTVARIQVRSRRLRRISNLIRIYLTI